MASPLKTEEPVGVWKQRRAFMCAVTAFCMAMIIWAVKNGGDSVVLQTVVIGSFGLLTAITGCYVFGAAWDDKNARDFALAMADKSPNTLASLYPESEYTNVGLG